MVFDLHRHLNITTTTTNGFLPSSGRLFTATATSDERDAPMGVVENREKEFLDARSSYRVHRVIEVVFIQQVTLSSRFTLDNKEYA